MKRDMELIRLLLVQQDIGEVPPELQSYSTEAQIYNMQLMDDAKLIVAEFMFDEPGKAPNAHVYRLTWAGHDFLDATRDKKIWERAKEHIIKPGASWTFQTLLEFLKREIDQRFLGAASISP